MTLAEFVLLLQDSPKLFGQLLQQQQRGDSPELRQSILGFYAQMTQADIRAYEERNILSHTRLLRLARMASLVPELSSLPLLLFQSYVVSKHPTTQSQPTFTEEEVRFFLTGGHIPIDCCFLVSGKVRIWDKSQQAFLHLYILDGDPALHQATITYLESIHSSFSSLNDARDEVRRRKLD